jgi:hypothetical protein
MADEKLNRGGSAIEIRFVFVEMLFALTIAEVATQVATLVEGGVGLREAASSYTHLLLATILVAASYIGWKNSVAKGNRSPVEEVFRLGFLVLLLDLALVVFYFILARGAEKPVHQVVTPSAQNETTWILIIFVGYFIWDVLTKAVPTVTGRSFVRRIFGIELWERGWITFVCVLLAGLIWWLLKNASSQTGVVLADLSLLSLVLLFRAFKAKTTRWTLVCSVVLLVALMGSRAAERLLH